MKDGHCLLYIVTNPSKCQSFIRSGQRQDRVATYMAFSLKNLNMIGVTRSQEVLEFSISMHCVVICVAIRSKSGVSYRRPRTRNQVHYILHDPRQRGVPCSSTAFRRSTITQPLMHETSMRATSSRRRSLLHDVELELVDVELVLRGI